MADNPNDQPDFSQAGFSQEEIDAIVRDGGGEPGAGSPAPTPPAPTPGDTQAINQDDIDALISGETAGGGDAASDQPASADDGPASVGGESAAADAGQISQADIDAMMSGGAAAEGDIGASGAAPAEAGEMSQADIDALMGGGAGDAGASDTIDQDDIDALMNAAGAGGDDTPDGTAGDAVATADEPDDRLDSLGRPFDDAAAAMQAAIEAEQASTPPKTEPAVDVQPYEPQGFEGPGSPDVDPKRVTMLNDVRLRVKIQLGRTRMLVEDVLKIGEGSVVELDKLAGDPVDVLVNDRLIARGEVLVLNDSFCVRISEVLSHDPHRVSV